MPETTLILRPIGLGDPDPTFPRCTPFPGGSQNWETIDEEVADDFATYNQHAGAGTGETAYSYLKIDTLQFPPLPSNLAPTKVAARMRAYRTAGSGRATSHLLIGGNKYTGAQVPFFFINNWTDGFFEWTLNPATGLPWSRSDFPLQAGYTLAISFEFGLCRVYCTQFQLEVTGDQSPIWPSALPVVTEDLSIFTTELIH